MSYCFRKTNLLLAFLVALASPLLGQEAAPQPAPQPTKLAPTRQSQDCQFTKIDLDLLKQVDVFDKYVEEKGWVYNDPETNAYLEKLGATLVPAQTPENVKWHFRTMRDLDVNAFALPNGSIYVNSGLLSRMENDA
jgi:predicted Zn-dependent protease